MYEHLLAMTQRPVSRVLAGNSRLAQEAVKRLVRESTPFHVEPYPFDQYQLTVVEEVARDLRSFMLCATRSWCGGDTVKAEVYSDDFAMSATFDCAHFLDSATEPELLQLVACGFRGDFRADVVAHFMADYDCDVRAILTYVEREQLCFEVAVNANEARAWLAKHRPEVDISGRPCPAL
jgi:hypothetical protein